MSRLIPGFPKDALCYLLGLSHISVPAFLIIATPGRLLGTILLSLEGSYLRKNQDFGFFVTLAITGLILLLGYFFVKKQLNEFRKKRRRSKAAIVPQSRKMVEGRP